MEIALLEKSGSKLASLLVSVLDLPAQKSILGTGSYTGKHVSMFTLMLAPGLYNVCGKLKGTSVKYGT
jgi:hypothetical protein